MSVSSRVSSLVRWLAGPAGHASIMRRGLIGHIEEFAELTTEFRERPMPDEVP
jgi:hypothetical protein